ncbi:hypothetical protein [Haloarchaeobius sp. DFWS5]|uniref:hypothetical protein n=1 Tax=Haloarchaeobius sp. DFWS5 TaxID=3446114 RepID=UPI003EB77DF8
MARRTPHTEHDALPVVADESRSYVRIRPTVDALDAETVAAQFRRLHQVRLETASTSLLDRVSAPPRPTIKALLVGDGDETTYYVGVETDAIDAVTRILRSLYPDGYEFTRMDWAPDRLVPANGPIAAVEYCGQVDRAADWQTQLTPFETFLTDTSARVPLASIVEAMAESASHSSSVAGAL